MSDPDKDVSAAQLAAAERRGYERGYREAKDIEGRRAAHRQMLRVVDGLVGAAMLNGDSDALDGAAKAMSRICLPTPCRECNGSGVIGDAHPPYIEDPRCPGCHGTGRIVLEAAPSPPQAHVEERPNPIPAQEEA